MQRSEGGGSFQAVDTLNGKLLCGCDDLHACVVSFLILFFIFYIQPILGPLIRYAKPDDPYMALLWTIN